MTQGDIEMLPCTADGKPQFIDPLVLRLPHDSQDTISLASSQNLPFPGSAFNLRIDIVPMADREIPSDLG